MLVVGAGVTGATFAKLWGKDAFILEKMDRIGGKAKSYPEDTEVGRFHFDIGGHWFHCQSAPEIMDLLADVPLKLHERKALVYMFGRYFDFPIQKSYRDHEDKKWVAKVSAELEAASKNKETPKNYDEFLRSSYGPTLYKDFFLPYNQKLFGVEDLTQLLYSKLETVRNVKADGKSTGYNNHFYYPEGTLGAQAIPDAVIRGTTVWTGWSLDSINLERGILKASSSDGQELEYDFRTNGMVSTIPLKDLVNMIEDAPEWLKQEASTLRFSPGLIINMGVKRIDAYKDTSWIYFPDLDLPFYRVGFYSNVEPALAPEGYTSMYVEVSPLIFRDPYNAFELALAKMKVISALLYLGLLESEEDIQVMQMIGLKMNYCFHTPAAKRIRDFLAEHNIYSIGRYGTWHWSSQHEDMAQAAELVRRLKAGEGLP